jgi:hypothetical protein
MKRRSRIAFLVVVSGLLLASVGGVAVAANISCSRSTCEGTGDVDVVDGGPGRDFIDVGDGGGLDRYCGGEDVVADFAAGDSAGCS